jgi:hypothetical protein
MFTKKDKQDGSICCKSRCCSKGYEVVPGKEASNTSIRISFCIYLPYDDFGALEGTINVLTLIEWPDGMQDLGFASQDDIDKYCIQLLKSMYGNVDARNTQQRGC